MAAAAPALGEVEEAAASKPSGPEEKNPPESGVDTRAESTNCGRGSEAPRAPRPGKSMKKLVFNLGWLMQRVQPP